MRIRTLVNDDSKVGKQFNLFIQFIIIISIVSFSIETLPDISLKLRKLLRITEIVTVSIFSVEYILRFIAASHKIKYIFSFFALIDLLAILPFYIAIGIDLRSIRALRLLRLFRILKVVRYSAAIKHFKIALSTVKEELVIFFFAAIILMYFASVGIYYFENPSQPDVFSSVFDGMWWSVATFTTVGYGDVYPITLGGKIFTFLILIIGLGIVAVPTGIIATALNKTINNN